MYLIDYRAGKFTRLLALTIATVITILFTQTDVALAFDLPPNFSNEQVLGNLAEPDSLEFSPDGRMFISERVTGRLLVAKYNPATDSWNQNSQPFYIFDVPKDTNGTPQAHRSAGLRNIAFDPDFANNGFVYAFYMPNDDRHNRVVRIRASATNPDVADASFGEELLLRLPFNEQISTGSHNGGALIFGNDGMLYVSTGDGWEGDHPGDSVQSLSTFTGKILRIEPDGTIPATNPFYNQTAGDYRAIYALGLRNPYAMAQHPNSGLLYINEARGSKKDQIYIVEAGANYQHEGNHSGIGTNRQPWATAADTGGQLITGGAWYPSSGGTFPAEYAGVYFTPLWGGNNDAKGKISYIASASDQSVAIFEDNVGITTSSGLAIKPVMTQVGPDGDLYYLLTTYITNQGTVQRIRWTDQATAQTPVLDPAGGRFQSAQTVTMASGTIGAEIRYTIDGSQPISSSTLYTAPIAVDADRVIHARAFKAGLNPSGVASEVYTINAVKNIPPQVDAGDDQTVIVRTTVTLDGSGTTDPDGDDDLLFDELWTQLSGPPVAIIDESEEIAYFIPETVGTYSFRLEMSDGQDVGYDEVTFTVINQPATSACGQNILSNPGFEESPAFTGWRYFSKNGGNHSISGPAYSGSSAAKVTIQRSSNNIQLYQAGLQLQPNTTYQLSFAAYSTGGRDLKLRVQEHDQDYTNYGLNNYHIDIQDSWANHTLEFTTSRFNSPVNDGRLMFWLANHANAGDTYWFDDICLTSAINMTPSPTPVPPTDTPQPTATPTDIPADTPTPTDEPTATDTPLPTIEPTDIPTDIPTETPTDIPADTPTPTDEPTTTDTPLPTSEPTDIPTETPTYIPADTPTPTDEPTATDTPLPTSEPTDIPTQTPTDIPADTPTPTDEPTATDTPLPTPTSEPTDIPTQTPTDIPVDTPTPTDEPTATDTPLPTSEPTDIPTDIPTETPTPIPTSTPQGPTCTDNVLLNPEFEEAPDLTGWHFYSKNGGGKDVDRAAYGGSNAARVTVQQPSNNIQFYQFGIDLQPNTDYRLSFAAYSTAGRDLTVRLQEHDQNYTNYGLNNVLVDIQDSWSYHSIDFTTSRFHSPVNDGRLMFWLASHASAGDSYWFDNVCLTASPGASPTSVPATPTIAPSPTLEPTAETVEPPPTATVLPTITPAPTEEPISTSVPTAAPTSTSEPSPTSAPPTSLPPTACVNNVLLNPGFEESPALIGWKYYSQKGGSKGISAPAYESSSAAKVTVQQPSNNIQLYQSGVNLKPYTTYRLSFAAYSTAGQDLAVRLQEHNQDYTNYGLNNVSIDLSGSWGIHSVEFTTSGFSSPVNDGRLMFWLAGHANAGDAYWFDEVCLSEVTNAVQASGKPMDGDGSQQTDGTTLATDESGNYVPDEALMVPALYLPVVQGP